MILRNLLTVVTLGESHTPPHSLQPPNPKSFSSFLAAPKGQFGLHCSNVLCDLLRWMIYDISSVLMWAPKGRGLCFIFWCIQGAYPSASEKAMAPHSSTLAWRIPWMEEPGGLQSMRSLKGHDWATSLSLFTFMHWRRKWHPTPVFLPGESQGRGSLAGCRLWGRTESDMTEMT